MNVPHHLVSCLLPSLLVISFLPALRKKPKMLARLLALPLFYFLLWAIAYVWGERDIRAIKLISFSLLGLGVLIGLRSLVLYRLIPRVIHIATSLVLLVTSCSFTSLGEAGTLLSGAVGLLCGTMLMVVGLMIDIETQWGQPLDTSCGGGAAFLFPRHSGIILTCLILFGSVPGSLLFLIEDALLHEMSEWSIVGCGIVLFVTGIASISAYRIFTQCFCGRTLFEFPARMRIEPSRWLGFVLLLFFGAGLMPGLFL